MSFVCEVMQERRDVADAARMALINEQILRGWGDTPGDRIPDNWRECKPKDSGDRTCPICGKAYTLWRSGGKLMCSECWRGEPGINHRREVQRELYQRRRQREGYLESQCARGRDYRARMREVAA